MGGEEAMAAHAIIDKHAKHFYENPKMHMAFIKQITVREVKNKKAVVNWMLSPHEVNGAEVDQALWQAFALLGGVVRAGSQAADPVERAVQEDI